MHGEPARLVVWFWRVEAADRTEEAGVRVLGVAPQLVGPHVGGVEVRFSGIEDHAVDGRGGRVVVVLDVFFQDAGAVDAEDVAMAGLVVERVAVDMVRRSLSGEQEYGTGFGVGGRCFGCGSVRTASVVLVGSRARTVSPDGMRGIVLDLSRALDGMAGPFLHGCAVDLLLVVLHTLSIKAIHTSPLRGLH